MKYRTRKDICKNTAAECRAFLVQAIQEIPPRLLPYIVRDRMNRIPMPNILFPH